jgi:hypothetical protein
VGVWEDVLRCWGSKMNDLPRSVVAETQKLAREHRDDYSASTGYFCTARHGGGRIEGKPWSTASNSPTSTILSAPGDLLYEVYFQSLRSL